MSPFLFISAFQVPECCRIDHGTIPYCFKSYIKADEKWPTYFVLNFITIENELWVKFRTEMKKLIRTIVDLVGKNYLPSKVACTDLIKMCSGSLLLDYLYHGRSSSIQNWLLEQWTARCNVETLLPGEVRIGSEGENTIVVGQNFLQINSDMLINYVIASLKFNEICRLPCSDEALELICNFLYARHLFILNLKDLCTPTVLWQVADIAEMLQIQPLKSCIELLLIVQLTGGSGCLHPTAYTHDSTDSDSLFQNLQKAHIHHFPALFHMLLPEAIIYCTLNFNRNDTIHQQFPELYEIIYEFLSNFPLLNKPTVIKIVDRYGYLSL